MAGDYVGARRMIKRELAKDPEDHWLLEQLSLTYYEQFEYSKSLELSSKALEIAPECPLVRWGVAGSLEMLNRPQEALEIYQGLVDQGAESLAYSECGEGLARARGLVADCLYRMANCYAELGDKRQPLDLLEAHLKMRGPGCRSIYEITQVRARLERLKAEVVPC